MHGPDEVTDTESRLPTGATAEIEAGRRFAFGSNWQDFLTVVDEESILQAENGLRDLLHVTRLDGKLFLDVGCGSGLSSLAAHRLGAKVFGFDYDPASVAATTELRGRYGVPAESWSVEQGSALDPAYMRGLPRADVVYSWGVLHHTGDMWSALENVCLPVPDGGTLALALYNDQGLRSRLWRRVKRLYCSGALGRAAVLAATVPAFVLAAAGKDVLRGRSPVHRYRHKVGRGMSTFHDLLDWLGGYPFEVATPDAVVAYFTGRGFTLENIRTVGGRTGCNEFVFSRRTAG